MLVNKEFILFFAMLLPLSTHAIYAACKSGEECKYILVTEIKKYFIMSLSHLYEEFNFANQDAVKTLQESLKPEDARNNELTKLLKHLKDEEPLFKSDNLDVKKRDEAAKKYCKQVEDLNTEKIDLSMVEVRRKRAIVNTINSVLEGWKHNQLKELKELPGYDALDEEIKKAEVNENNYAEFKPLVDRIFDFVQLNDLEELKIFKEA